MCDGGCGCQTADAFCTRAVSIENGYLWKNKITHVTWTERVWPERGLNGAALKWIAMCSMFIDHIGAVVLEYGLYYQGGAERMDFLLEQSWGVFLYPLSLLLRILGRPAFLIYCFLLVEGFVHTRDRKKYGRNLLLFGLISEIPFNLAVANRVFDPMYQNVFFELFIGFLILCWIERAEKRTYGPKEMDLVCLYTFIGCGAAVLAGADYNAVGILIIVFLYRFRNSRRKQTVAAGVLGFDMRRCSLLWEQGRWQRCPYGFITENGESS